MRLVARVGLMNTAYIMVTVSTAMATAGIAVTNFIPAKFVLAHSTEVGVSWSWLPTLEAVKLAEIIWLVIGLLGLSVPEITAAAGLVLFSVGAVVAHLRILVLYNIGFPGCYLLLSTE